MLRLRVKGQAHHERYVLERQVETREEQNVLTSIAINLRNIDDNSISKLEAGISSHDFY